MTTDQPTLRERLQAGPGSRELSDAFLLEMGCKLKELGRVGGDYPTSVAIDPSGKRMKRLDCSQSTDDALAMVPEGYYPLIACGNMWDGRTGLSIEPSSVGIELRSVQGTSEFHAKATGNNPLPRAICLAILSSKEADDE